MLLAEVLWTRSLLQLDRLAWAGFFATPVDGFALVTVTVLLGTVGSATLATRLEDAPREVIARTMATTLAWGGVIGLLALEWFTVAGARMAETPWREWPPWLVTVRLAPILPAAALLGVSFPLAARLYAGAGPGSARRLGTAGLANALGGTAGALAGGLVVIPRAGSGAGLVACAGGAVALGALCLLAARPRVRDRVSLLLAAGAVVVVATAVPLAPGQFWRRAYGEASVLASWEGWESATMVVERPDDRRVLATDGRTIVVKQNHSELAASLERLAPGAETALLVGYGTGTLAAAVLRLPEVRSLTIVEIDPSQFQAAAWFEAGAALKDPRVERVVDDAVHFLEVNRRTFDLVLVDGWGPDLAPALYTADFEERVRARLTPRGVVWVKVPPLEPEWQGPVADAVRCVHPYAFAIGNPPAALVGAAAGDGTIDPLAVPLPGPDAPCSPLRHLRPRRIRPALDQAVDPRGR